MLASSGRQIGELSLNESIKDLEIVNINWWGGYDSYYENEIYQRKHLMIAFKNGTVILIEDRDRKSVV